MPKTLSSPPETETYLVESIQPIQDFLDIDQIAHTRPAEFLLIHLDDCI